MSIHKENVSAVILCGGLGTRMQSVVAGRQKVLAETAGRPFLAFVIESLMSVGIRHIVLCTGHLKEQVREEFRSFLDCTIVFSEEDSPLGTGGALKKALPLVKSDSFLVMNGDSLCAVPFKSFFDFHREKAAILSMVLVSDDRIDGGFVSTNSDGAVTGFAEKDPAKRTNRINAGIYLMKKDIARFFPNEEKFSLEYDLFPKLLSGMAYGFPIEAPLLEIGTPDRYEAVQNKIAAEGAEKYFYA
jgi:NDP-sugar pyrophosphorylase family protein